MEDLTEAEKSYYFCIRISRIKRRENNVEEIELQNLFWGKVSTLDEIPKMIEERLQEGKNE